VRRLHPVDAADPRLDAHGDPGAGVEPQGPAQHALARVLSPPRLHAPRLPAELPHAGLLRAHRPPLPPRAGHAAREAPPAPLGQARVGVGDRLARPAGLTRNPGPRLLGLAVRAHTFRTSFFFFLSRAGRRPTRAEGAPMRDHRPLSAQSFACALLAL